MESLDASCNGVNFGHKTIGFVGSLAMLLNNILGPGIANFPAAFQRAGWLAPCMLIAACGVSSLASGEMLVMAMRALPGNESFEKRVEYSTLCRHYLPSKAAACSSLLFLLAMLAANISNIIQTSHVLDSTVDALFSDSCAVEFYPSFLHFFCGTNPTDVTPFGTGKVLLSLGTISVAVFSVPLSYWNLDDNIVFQNISLVFIILALFIWFGIFFILGLEPSRTPMVRTESGLSAFHGLGGTVLFNFMFISTLPSWICEKQPQIVAIKAIFWTLVLAAVGFLGVGVWGGMAFEEYYETDNTLLSELHHLHASRRVKLAAGFSVNAYAIAANLASIPIYSIMLRYNIIEQNLMGTRAANFLSITLPWVLSILLYCGTGFADLVDFAGTFTSSIVNLIVPSILFISSQRPRSWCLPRPPLSAGCEVHMQTMTSKAEPADTPLLAAAWDDPWIRCRELGSVVGQAPACGDLMLDSLGSFASSAEIAHDRSGLLESAGQKRAWLAIAWLNIFVMATLTGVSIMDQVANRS